MLGQGHVHLLIVRLWNAGDRVYDANGHDLGYRPAPGSTAELQQLERVGIRVVPEKSFGAVPGIVRRFVGSGPTAEPQRRHRLTPLAPVAVLASIVPFGFVLVRSRR